MLLACAIAWYIMQHAIIRAQGPQSALRRALGRDWKGTLSPVLYAIGIGVAFVQPAMAAMVYALVALVWLVPDLRVHHAAKAAAAGDPAEPA